MVSRFFESRTDKRRINLRRLLRSDLTRRVDLPRLNNAVLLDIAQRAERYRVSADRAQRKDRR
jgi:hypothetical protein